MVPTAFLLAPGAAVLDDWAALGLTRVRGAELGRSAEGVLGATVGGRSCPLVAWSAQEELFVAVPPGVGAAADVLVLTAGGLSNQGQASPVSVGYSPPQVLAVSPPIALMPPSWDAGESVGVQVELTGLDHVAGQSSSGPAVSIRLLDSTAGLIAECTALQRLADTATGTQRLSCQLPLQAFDPESAPLRDLSLQLQVADQSVTTQAGVLTLVGRPIVTGIQPEVASTGGEGNATLAPVTLEGQGFGTLPGHVAGVTVGGKPCPLVQWVSSSRLLVAVPPGVGGGVPVVVQLQAGLASQPGPNS